MVSAPAPTLRWAVLDRSRAASPAPTAGVEGTEARDEVRALVRLMIKKGVFTKDEFLKELQEVMLY